ncbi:hypothetical protein C8R47DRAFT_1107106 [Mycena vitilis]|nr:hypothetical protein C8R47DRAFT_1107106 [Mycena vitilis]
MNEFRHTKWPSLFLVLTVETIVQNTGHGAALPSICRPVIEVPKISAQPIEPAGRSGAGTAGLAGNPAKAGPDAKRISCIQSQSARAAWHRLGGKSLLNFQAS